MKWKDEYHLLDWDPNEVNDNNNIQYIINDKYYNEKIDNYINKDNYNIKKDIYNINKTEDLKKEMIIKINKYKNATSLNNIFNKRSDQGSRQPDQAPRRWSPQSNAGNVYEWNRGVIAISPDGQILKEKLDGTTNHHADATVRISNQLGIMLEPTNQPYLAGCIASENNLVIFQSEGDSSIFYLPELISEAQAKAIEDIAKPRKDFNFSIAYKEFPIDDITYDNLIRFVNEKTQALAKAI